jgi:hypothetical protein
LAGYAAPGAVASSLSPKSWRFRAKNKFVRLSAAKSIMCDIAPPESEGAIIISLTHVRVDRSLLLATAVLDYQKHRVKKLKKQGRS